MRAAVLLLTLCTASGCFAQSASTQISVTNYRLTFVLSNPQGTQPSRSITLDVPVIPGHPGNASTVAVARVTDEAEKGGSIRLSCTDVHASPTGLSVDVAYSEESVRAPVPGSVVPIHRQLNFEKKVDLVLGKAMQITEPMHVKLFKEGDATRAPAPPPATQITVTATRL